MAHDILEPHFLSERIIAAFREMLAPIIKEIDEVYLVKRKVKYIPEDPLWIVVVKSAVPWYKICLHNPKRLISNYLFEKLNGFFGVGSYYISVDFDTYIKKAHRVSDSLVYKK